MSRYEIFTLLVGIIGALTGVTSLIRTHLIAKKQLEFQATAAALAKRQLLALTREEAAKRKADVGVALVQVGRGEYRFVISNDGDAPAENVHFRIADNSPDNPLIDSECKQKLPYPKLDPGQSSKLIASRDMGSAVTYQTYISWRNQDGSTDSRDLHVSL
jgi:hypothetical protein